MRSPAEPLTVGHTAVRPVLEWACRLAAIGLLAWALFAAMRGRDGVPATTVAASLDSASATTQLHEWSRQPGLARLHVALASVPDATARDWLRALDDAGTGVTWEGDILPTAVAVERLADPRGGAWIAAAAPDGEPILVADAVGRIDSLVASGGGASVRAPSTTGTIVVRAGGVAATEGQPADRDVRDVVVLGRAGWEAKFVAAALEEHGWRVSARFRVAPGLSVGSLPALDTARVSAVIALDTTASDQARAIAAYVRNGGGLVVASEAARLPALAALAPGRPGAAVRAASSYAAAIAPVTRLTLAHSPLTELRRDAVPLERRGDTILVAARRVDAGRVVQSGYDETWRWRMAGGDDSPEAHRTWWASLVESVAYAPVQGGATDVPDGVAGRADRAAGARGEPAPRAALVAALGAPSRAPGGALTAPTFDPSRSLAVYIAAALLLLVEWGSRRLRGRL